MKQYQTYLFDWDGTIAQTLEVWLKVIKDLCNEFGVFPSDKDIADHFGDWEAARAFGLAEDQIPKYVKELEERSHKAIPNAPLYPDAKDVLNKLKNDGKQLALITSSIRRTIELVIEHHGLGGIFDVVVTGNDVRAHKPDPECIDFAVDALGAEKADSIMVGDSIKDLGAADNAGIDSMLFYPPAHELFYSPDYFDNHKPTYTIHSWAELNRL